MGGYEYILSKQIQWAVNRGYSLIGSKNERGRQTYTNHLDQNLFEPLEESTKERFLKGDGKEILDSPEGPAKMQALHSSSALGVNIFQYWQKRGLTNEIAAACGFCNKGSDCTSKIVFEDKYRIKTKFVVPPNIDVVFHTNDRSQFQRFAIECKFSEAYFTTKHDGLKEKYLLESDLWDDIPALHELAKEISPEDNRYQYLHVAQLIKHILGLKAAFGMKSFKLLYLWYDVLGKDGADHRADIEDFITIAKKDGIHVHSMTYQELIILLARDYRDIHSEYIKYVTERYL